MKGGVNMSICSFIETAKILYRDKKYEEALCLVCNAVDACAVKNILMLKKIMKDISYF